MIFHLNDHENGRFHSVPEGRSIDLLADLSVDFANGMREAIDANLQRYSAQTCWRITWRTANILPPRFDFILQIR